MRRSKHKRRSSLLLEALGASVILVALVAAFSYVMVQSVRNQDIVLARQQAVLAAEAALNEIRAGVPMTPDDFEKRFRGMTLDVATQDGTGQWTGFSLVTVSVHAEPAYDQVIEARVKGYIPEKQP